ncbi:hypothetical protein GALMADRAFT_1168188 [Galerina marginata CBS 339.88]|uniref:Peptidase C14 caspase domain-containing protein n=1 Tax=Galerina marginata (strain CBS 339.88) TaxID=685588 RepID=A0A067TJ28_GALM3|nr:hypothetical protein GALMADRAFT_1168188 [Galerina marginata CBS 339.88]
MTTPSPRARFRLIRLCLQATNNLRDAVTRPRRLATPRKKFALVIGISYKKNKNKNWRLNGSQTDVESVKDLLINTLQFSEEEIVVISDADGTPEKYLPTYSNIMREVEEFVKADERNVDYFLVYSGHSSQRKEVLEAGQRPVEKDGQEEYIIPLDALLDKPDFEEAVVHERIISDKTLNKWLVKRLGKGSQLVALFDSCHSGTMLNLRHIRCNRVGDLMSLVQESARRVFVEPWYARFTKRAAPPPVSRGLGEAPRNLRKRGTQLSSMSHDSIKEHRWTMECPGFCPRTPSAGKSQVICFSACKDEQATLESDGGGTMINAIVQLLKKNQRPSYRDVIFAAREGTFKVKENIKKDLDISSTKKSWRKFIPFYKSCPTPKEENLQNMARMEFDPQLSTLRSLNTKGLLRICDRVSVTTPPVTRNQPTNQPTPTARQITGHQVKFDPLPTRGISSQEFNRRQSLAGRPA